jgi:hypothetical protein
MVYDAIRFVSSNVSKDKEIAKENEEAEEDKNDKQDFLVMVRKYRYCSCHMVMDHSIQMECACLIGLSFPT